MSSLSPYQDAVLKQMGIEVYQTKNTVASAELVDQEESFVHGETINQSATKTHPSVLNAASFAPMQSENSGLSHLARIKQQLAQTSAKTPINTAKSIQMPAKPIVLPLVFEADLQQACVVNPALASIKFANNAEGIVVDHSRFNQFLLQQNLPLTTSLSVENKRQLWQLICGFQ